MLKSSQSRPDTLLCLVRHGETDWNSQGRLQGHTDTSLNSKGIDQAREAGRQLASHRWDALYSSHLRRALETAEMIGEMVGLSPRVDRWVSERFFGAMQGLTPVEMDTRFPWHRRSRIGIPGLEPDEVFAERAARAMDRIARTHPGERVLVVTHGGFMRTFLQNNLLLSSIPRGISNCEARRVLYLGPGSWVLDYRPQE